MGSQASFVLVERRRVGQRKLNVDTARFDLDRVRVDGDFRVGETGPGFGVELPPVGRAGYDGSFEVPFAQR